MRKLYIISKMKQPGSITGDSGELTSYTELGWEIYTSGLRIKTMILNGDIKNHDVIMTHPDRAFMYRDMGPAVVEYDEEFISNFKGQVVDLTKDLMKILDECNFRHLTEIEKRALSFNSAKLSFKPTKKFVCIVLRLRNWVSARGGPVNFWLDQMRSAKDAGYDVFCVGKESNNFIPDYVQYVSLEDYAALISHDLCERSIGPSSGCMLLNHAFGKSKTEVLFFADDFSQIDRGDGLGHLLIFGKQGNLNIQNTTYYKVQ
jgi:hypothetical protein